MLRPRRAPTRALTEAICGSRTAPETASTAAQRNTREPCLSVVPVVVKDADGFWDGAWGASVVPARAVSGRGGRSRPGRRPARRGSLDGPVSCREHNELGSPPGLPTRRLLFVQDVLLVGDVGRRMRASLLISALGARCGVGSKMAFGVSRREVVRPLVLGRLSNRAGSNKVAGAGRRSSTGGRRRTPPSGSSGAQAATAKAASPVVRSVW
jgi:hypothetical protein